MGCFDSVFLRCPNCNSKVEAQSKVGQCRLSKWNIFNAPPDILLSLKDEVFHCRDCGADFKLKVQVITHAETVLLGDDYEEEYDDEE